MAEPIRLRQVRGDSDNSRLNLFAGRHLSEHSFDLQQAYVDGRVAPLLGNRTPGILDPA